MLRNQYFLEKKWAISGHFGPQKRFWSVFFSWVNSIFLILFTDSWQWYLTTSGVGLVVETIYLGPKVGYLGPIWAQNEVFVIFSILFFLISLIMLGGMAGIDI